MSTYTKKKILKEKKSYIIAYLDQHPCVDCGNTNVIVLEFDHVRGNKKGTISSMVRSSKIPMKILIEEVKKCEVRCSNCHKIVTHGRKKEKCLRKF